MSTTLEDLVKQRNAAVDEAKGLIDKAKEETRALTEDETEKLRTLDDSYKSLGAEIEKQNDVQELIARGASMEHMQVPGIAPGTTPSGTPDLYGGAGNVMSPEQEQEIRGLFRTPGESFAESAQYQGWLKAYPNGGPSISVETFSQPLEVPNARAMMGMRTPTEKVRSMLQIDESKLRTLVTSDNASAGELVLSLRRGLLEPGLVRPLTIRDLVTVIPVTTDTVEWVRELSREENAAPVEEATAITGTSGTKPQGGLTFEKVTEHIRTIAEWVPVTKRIVADAGQIRAYIDQYLSYDLSLELEDQIVGGSGTGEDFLGILNDPDVQTQTGGNTVLHDLRHAKRKVRTVARTNANGIVMNPEDIADMDLLRDLSGGANTGQFLGQSPFQYTGNDRVWGLPIVESEAVDPGTAIVADFARAILFDRESTNISVGTAGDDFIRNIVRILGELRAGFGIVRPKAFVIVTL